MVNKSNLPEYEWIFFIYFLLFRSFFIFPLYIVHVYAFLFKIKGNFGFDKIGTAYPEGIPLFALRFAPAVCGSALTPTIYLILCELGLSPVAGCLAGVMFLFGKKIN